MKPFFPKRFLILAVAKVVPCRVPSTLGLTSPFSIKWFHTGFHRSNAPRLAANAGHRLPYCPYDKGPDSLIACRRRNFLALLRVHRAWSERVLRKKLKMLSRVLCLARGSLPIWRGGWQEVYLFC
jgi:hypothetical protein